MTDKVWGLFVAFFKIGLFGFGGGNNLITLVQAEAVPRFVDAEEFSQLVGAQFAFPGLSAVKLAGLVGLRAAGIPGMAVAISALILPGLLLMAVLYTHLSRYRDHPVSQKILLALQFAGAALIAVTLWSLLMTTMKGRVDYRGLLLMAGVVLAVERFGVSPLFCVVGAIALGLFLF